MICSPGVERRYTFVLGALLSVASKRGGKKERKNVLHAHASGTAAMGKVVDAELKVYGISGLRVADASVPIGDHLQAILHAVAE